MSALFALSPLDGRYAQVSEVLSPFFSEAALIMYRVEVEAKYLFQLQSLGLKGLPPFTDENASWFLTRFSELTEDDLRRIKEIEGITNHDVKAVEYFMREEMEAKGMHTEAGFLHFGLTSQDINHTAFPMMIRDAEQQVLIPALEALIGNLKSLSDEWRGIPMLAYTHGQPASPTGLGKEFFVFVERLRKQLVLLKEIPYEGKFGGATGNFNAHFVAYPKIDWPVFATHFLNKDLGLIRQNTTTQIEQYDMLGARLDNWKRIAVILSDLCKDIWQYVSMNYFKQRIKEGEVGSSAMPHKVNPIDFENAEGNLSLAISLLSFFSAKLPISRLQRDLTDSTVLRNIGLPYGYVVLSLFSLQKGLAKIYPNTEKIANDLELNNAVLAEAIQTLLRREGVPHPYELLKELTRTGSHLTNERLSDFIKGLPISDEVKKEMIALTPKNYTGEI